MPDEREDEPGDLDQPPKFFPSEDDAPSGEPASYGEPVEVQIEGVYIAEGGGSVQRFVLVGDGYRRLPIMIGPFEAQAITLPLENARPDRPMTHDLLRNIIDKLEATLTRVVIDDLWNGTFYAKMYLVKGGQEMEIDARPSDAIAMALRFEAPVFVAEGILEQGAG